MTVIRVSAHPDSFSLRGCALVPDPFPRNLPSRKVAVCLGIGKRFPLDRRFQGVRPQFCRRQLLALAVGRAEEGQFVVLARDAGGVQIFAQPGIQIVMDGNSRTLPPFSRKRRERWPVPFEAQLNNYRLTTVMIQCAALLF